MIEQKDMVKTGLIMGILGLVTSFSTARSCLRSLLKEMDRASDRKDPPPAFNDHC